MVRHPALSRAARRRWPAASTRCTSSCSPSPAFFSLLIAGLIVYYAVKYRRRSPDERRREHPRRHAARDRPGRSIPFLITMVIFVWGASVFFAMSRPPDETLNIYVVGKQWMWKFQHLDGQREINELHVPVGRAVKLIMTSEDVIHDFFVPAFRVKADVHARPLHATSGSRRPSRAAITCSAPSTAARATRDDRRGRS